jgi:hypothetical protein
VASSIERPASSITFLGMQRLLLWHAHGGGLFSRHGHLTALQPPEVRHGCEESYQGDKKKRTLVG